LVTGPDGAALHEFELSFIGEETPLVPTPEQVRFVESAFKTKET
jgi:hypothetical protein